MGPGPRNGSAGTTAEYIASPTYTDSIFKQPSVIARILYRPRVGRNPCPICGAFLLPLRLFVCAYRVNPTCVPEGMERRAAQPSVHPTCGGARFGESASPFGAPSRLFCPRDRASGCATEDSSPSLSGKLSLAFTRTSSSHQRQTPIVGPDGYPGPPGGGVTSPARRRRHLPRPRLRLMRTPSDGEDLGNIVHRRTQVNSSFENCYVSHPLPRRSREKHDCGSTMPEEPG